MTQLSSDLHSDFVEQMTALHMGYYGAEWGFGPPFEALLRREGDAFVANFRPGRDLMLTTWAQGRLTGSVVIDGSERDGAGNHLRWFMTS